MRWSKRSAACSVRTSRACAAARSASTSRRSSRRSARSTTTVPTTSSPTPTCCRRSAVACARRKTSAKACARSARLLEPVAIGRLERFVGDMAIAEGWENVPYIEPSGYKVGIVGAGPAGMACAADMAKAGCEVIVYEAFHTPGGVLKYGIPDFRLPNTVIDAEIEKLRNLGVRFECNTLVGRLFTIEQMVTEMGFPRGLHRHRRRLSELHGHPRRIAERRAVGQRTAHALQPDAGARFSQLRHAAAAGQACRRHRRRQHGNGCTAGLAETGRRLRALHLPPFEEGSAGARRGDPPRRAGGRGLQLAHQPGRDPRRQEQQRARAALRENGTRRAG